VCKDLATVLFASLKPPSGGGGGRTINAAPSSARVPGHQSSSSPRRVRPRVCSPRRRFRRCPPAGEIGASTIEASPEKNAGSGPCREPRPEAVQHATENLSTARKRSTVSAVVRRVLAVFVETRWVSRPRTAPARSRRDARHSRTVPSSSW